MQFKKKDAYNWASYIIEVTTIICVGLGAWGYWGHEYPNATFFGGVAFITLLRLAVAEFTSKAPWDRGRFYWESQVRARGYIIFALLLIWVVAAAADDPNDVWLPVWEPLILRITMAILFQTILLFGALVWMVHQIETRRKENYGRRTIKITHPLNKDE